MKNKIIFYRKWPSSGCLNIHLAKSQIANFARPGHALVWSFNDLVGRRLASSLAHRGSENEKVLAHKENLLVPDDRKALFSCPVLIIQIMAVSKV